MDDGQMNIEANNLKSKNYNNQWVRPRSVEKKKERYYNHEKENDGINACMRTLHKLLGTHSQRRLDLDFGKALRGKYRRDIYNFFSTSYVNVWI